MAGVNLLDQLNRLIQQVQAEIDIIYDGYPLKGWFQNELKVLTPDAGDDASMEDLSARMRAVRQLEHIVRSHLADDAAPANHAESFYTQNSRLPGSLLEMVKQTNFSIEPKLLLEAPEQVDLFDLVSPTAKVVGYLRGRDATLTFAQRLSCPEESRAILDGLGITDDRVQEKMSLLFRARYHCINQTVARAAAPQVLEIASGISPRGLHWSRQYPGTVYIESDLPRLMREKAKVIRDTITADTVSRRGVLHCGGIDALDLASIRHALEYTDPEAGLVIVTEGLLLYFNADEMERFLSNMRAILTERPRAVWVVDFVTQRNLVDLFECDRAVAAGVKNVFASTQREVAAVNPFAHDDSVHDRLAAHGLEVRDHSPLADQAERSEIFPKSSRKDLRSVTGARRIWTVASSRAT